MEQFINNIENKLYDEEGFSTVGVALALLISLALIFSAAQVYEINSVSADVQDVADAAALAAENTVGEYCVVATLCDAVVLSLSLSSLTCLGLGVAAACTPVTVAASETLLQAAQKLKQTRDNFSQKASEALEKLKLVLPLAAAAKAASVIEKNSNMRASTTYTGMAILLPWETEELEEQNFSEADSAFESVDEQVDTLKEKGREAEEAAEKVNALKQQAYQYDSGSESAYCMYERAKSLANLDPYNNPYYASSETWDFDVALKRAQAYYPARLAQETPANNSIAEQARSNLRKRFYRYATEEIQKGFVNRSADSFDAYFPLLPKNTEEMKQTNLYTESCYPCSRNASGKLEMHAYSGCSEYNSQEKAGVGSIAQMDNNAAYEKCSVCEFSPSSMGSVAAASSSIDNGFEYHYRKVAELAKEYTEAHKTLEEQSSALKNQAQGLFDSIKEAFSEAVNKRIKIDPPGKYGAIAFVVTANPGSSNFLSQFVSNSTGFSTRAAIAGATLVPESSENGKTVINSILDGYSAEYAPAGIGITNVVLDVWSGILQGYGEGQAALAKTLENAINKLPLASESGLGKWAAGAFESNLENLGLEPADLSPQKAALVNTTHITNADNSNFSARLTSIKENTLTSQDANELFNSTIGEAKSSVIGAINNAEFTIEVATIEIVQGSVEIPVTISLPQSIKDAATSYVEQGYRALERTYASNIANRRWE